MQALETLGSRSAAHFKKWHCNVYLVKKKEKNNRITVLRWSSRSHATFSFAGLFVLFSILLSDFPYKQFVLKSEWYRKLPANSTPTSWDRIQYYDKKHNI